MLRDIFGGVIMVIGDVKPYEDTASLVVKLVGSLCGTCDGSEAQT